MFSEIESPDAQRELNKVPLVQSRVSREKIERNSKSKEKGGFRVNRLPWLHCSIEPQLLGRSFACSRKSRVSVLRNREDPDFAYDLQWAKETLRASACSFRLHQREVAPSHLEKISSLNSTHGKPAQ